MHKITAKEITRTGIMVSVALILSYVESLVPLPIPIPGIKIGLANMPGMVSFYLFDFKTAWLVTILRIIISAVLFGNIYSMIFSLAGGLLSLLIMSILLKSKCFGMIGISIAGAVSHNLGQVAAAALMVGSGFILAYIPALLAGGLAAGLIIGILSGMVINRIRKEGINNE